MAIQKYIDLIQQGQDVWNTWRKEHPALLPDLSGLDLRHTNLLRVNFSRTNLSNTNLSECNLRRANFSNANLSGSRLHKTILDEADLSGADLSGSDLSNTYLSGADLRDTNFNEANLRGAILDNVNLSRSSVCAADLRDAYLGGADLRGAFFVGTDLSGANLSETVLHCTVLDQSKINRCSVYNVLAGEVSLELVEQKDLVITSHEQPTITVDNLHLAQIVSLLYNNPDIRYTLPQLPMKSIVIIGRFPHEQLVFLNALKEEFRKQNYSPIVLFAGDVDQDLFKMALKVLSSLTCVVLVDLTDAMGILQMFQNNDFKIHTPVQWISSRTQQSQRVVLPSHDSSVQFPIFYYEGQESLGQIVQLVFKKLDMAQNIK